MKKTFVIVLTLIFWTTFLPSSVFSQEDREPYCEISNSHVVGDKCYCDDGYINYNGKCRTLEAVCRGFNARYSAAIKDCKCDDGYVEKNNYCVKEGEEITSEQKKEMEKNENSAGDRSEQVSSAKQKSEDSANDEKKESDGTQQLEEKSNVASGSNEAGENLTVEEKFKKMTEEHYSKYDPETQEIIKKNSDKIKELKESSLKPQDDIYGDIKGESDDGIIIAPFNVPIEESFELLDEEEREGAEDKMKFIFDFNLGDDKEISFKEEKNVMERVRDNAVDKEFEKETKSWNKEMKEAEKNNKFKEGVTKKDFEIEEEMEKRLKWQIATIKKSIGFEHLRIVETTGIVKKDKMHQPISFGTMTGEYKRYFKNKSAVDDNEWSSQGVAFNNSYRNIVGMGKQLETLKKSLKEQYPKDWKRKYLDVSVKPTKEEQEEKIGNVFDFIDKQIKEGQDEKD